MWLYLLKIIINNSKTIKWIDKNALSNKILQYLQIKYSKTGEIYFW